MALPFLSLFGFFVFVFPAIQPPVLVHSLYVFKEFSEFRADLVSEGIFIDLLISMIY